jgi:hypothetical protein
MRRLRSPLLWFILTLAAVAGLSAIAPQEASLGRAVRIVYLHAAWTLTAEIALGLSAAAGLSGSLFQRERLQRWSAALGRTGLVFWVSSLPLSLWAMQANWNGLFLAEPRFRVAVILAVTGILLQAGLALLARPVFTSIANFLFFTALLIGLSRAGYVMHPPPSPIFNSGNLLLEIYFGALTLLNLCAAGCLTWGWLQKQG